MDGDSFQSLAVPSTSPVAISVAAHDGLPPGRLALNVHKAFCSGSRSRRCAGAPFRGGSCLLGRPRPPLGSSNYLWGGAAEPRNLAGEAREALDSSWRKVELGGRASPGH